uniref:Uncharacterized protein n=1 Tax=Pseudo-nitzschia australis TaxID=44445 RepID=A0A7S4EMK9_9STRA|mmetsp:Transcript_17403/g.38112  ORF Transcript_17403/g.38112 Transcript_17403/m.38112 type:complete len:188 (+) Transcript_17403:162-725(+)
MSLSFSFSHKPLLHKTIEDQWFDRSPKETQSSLTALELAEEAYAERLANITMPDKPPVVIGKLQHLRCQELQARRMQADQQHHQQQQGGMPPRIRRSSNNRRSVSEMEAAHNPTTHDAAYYHPAAATDDNNAMDDVYRNSNRNNRTSAAATVVAAPASSATMSPARHQADMFWHRSRRSSAGGDRFY